MPKTESSRARRASKAKTTGREGAARGTAARAEYDGELEEVHAFVHRGAREAPEVTPLDHEIFALFAEAHDCVYSTRDLGLRSTDLTTKRAQRDALQRMVRAFYRLPDRDGAPYRAARAFFTDRILIAGTAARTHGLPVSTLSAAGVAAEVEWRFPSLAKFMRDPKRVERIRVAIAAAARSLRKRPWKEIVHAWQGIEALSRGGDPATTWRIDYAQRKRAEQEEP